MFSNDFPYPTLFKSEEPFPSNLTQFEFGADIDLLDNWSLQDFGTLPEENIFNPDFITEPSDDDSSTLDSTPSSPFEVLIGPDSIICPVKEEVVDSLSEVSKPDFSAEQLKYIQEQQIQLQQQLLYQQQIQQQQQLAFRQFQQQQLQFQQMVAQQKLIMQYQVQASRAIMKTPTEPALFPPSGSIVPQDSRNCKQPHIMTSLNTNHFGIPETPLKSQYIPVDISGSITESQYNKIFKKYHNQLELPAHPTMTEQDLENIKINGRMYFLKNVKTIVPKIGPWKFHAHLSHRRTDERQYNIPGMAITCKVKEWLTDEGLWRLYHYKKGKAVKSKSTSKKSF